MAKYEIMMIIDPKDDFQKVVTLANEVFDKPEIEKLDRTELAYEVNKSRTAHFVLINVEADGKQVKELTRRVNITKTIWRILVINLDTEIGREEGIAKLKARKKRLTEEFLARKKARESRSKQFER